jgi:sulfatase-like protein
VTTRDAVRNGAQLGGLWALAVAQPLFDVTRSGEAYVIAGWRGGDIALFALALALLPPALMLAAEAVAARIRPQGAVALHLALVGTLGAVLAGYLVKHETDLSTEAAAPVMLAAGIGAAYGFRRFDAVRSFTLLLSPAPVVFVALFLFGSPVRHLVFPADGSNLAGPTPAAPVVMIVFDEFPTLSLLDGRGEFDGRSYPAFASLARDGTWFRNATTVADFTVAAVPALLTGRHQDGGRPASVSAHPDNLLALFAHRGGVDARESFTRLCPRDACPQNDLGGLPRRIGRALPALGKVAIGTFLPDGLYRHLPDTDPYPNELADFTFERLWRAAGDLRPRMHYLHVELPHQPWTRLRSGRAYLPTGTNLTDFYPGRGVELNTGFPAQSRVRWTRDRARVDLMRQRHLAQVGYADTLLGRTIQRLRATGLYDRALVVVTADHGIAFEPGRNARRLSRATADAVLPVPLFVKLPHQRRGTVSDRFVQSIDVAPTIAAAVGLRLPWRVDGRSALDASSRDRRRLVANAVETDDHLELDARAVMRERRGAAALQAALFRGDGPDRIFRTGPHPELVGRSVAGLRRGPPAPLRHAFVLGDRVAFDPRSGEAPALLAGSLTGPDAAGRELAVIVAGRVAALATSYRARGRTRFVAFAPESSFRPGSNELSLYSVEPVPGGVLTSEIPRM